MSEQIQPTMTQEPTVMKNPAIKVMVVKIVKRKRYIEVVYVKVDGVTYRFNRVFNSYMEAMDAIRAEIERL